MIAQNAFSLLLATLVAADLAQSGLKVVQLFRTPDLVAGVSPLDSFSTPSAAAAILKEEAETLLFDYAAARDAACASDRSATHGSRQIMKEQHPEADLVSRIQPLEKLYTTVQDLNLELYQKLLVVYSENHLENELVDTFLLLLQNAPERPEVLSWVRIALDCSQHCGRTEELEDAVHHALRFHPNLKTAAPLADLMQACEAAH
jgi:hypothetical protein